MDIIYLLLREFRYIFKSRKIKKYLTIIIIYILFLFLLSAFSVSKASYDFTYNDVNYSLNDVPNSSNYYAFVVMVNGNNEYIAFCSPAENTSSAHTTIHGSGSSNYINFRFVNDITDYRPARFKYNFSTNEWEKYTAGNDTNGDTFIYGSREFVYSTVDIYQDNTVIFKATPLPEKTPPFITNKNGSIENWDFDYLQFDSGSYTYFDNISIQFYYSTDNTNWQQAETFNLDTNSSYVTRNNPFTETFTANIPKADIFKNFTLKSGDYVGFQITYNGENDYYGGYQLSVSNSSSSSEQNYTQQFNNLQNSINGTTQAIESQTNAINNQTTKIEEQTNAINGTTQAVNDTNNFLKDNTVDDSQFNLPSVDVNDPTSNFFDTIFMGLYNAVTNNEEKTISFEILGNNISISSADFNYLNGNEWNVLRIILSSMWVFGVGIYILKDIRKMIDKIKDGNVENMATDDIKANMV